MDASSTEEITRLRQQLSQMSDLLDAEKAAKRLPKNMDFVQVSRADMRAIAELGAKNSIALKLLMTFAQTMDRQNAVMISFKAMEEIMGKSRPTLDRAIRLLKEDNWLQVVKVGTANAYVLNSAVFWPDSNDKRSMTNFTARIVTTLNEQDMDLRKNRNVRLKRTPTIVPNGERVILDTEPLPPPDQQDLDLN